MRYLIAAVLSLMCFTSQVNAQSECLTGFFDSRSHMFDGIDLSEQQRQHLRDLTGEFRLEQPQLAAQDFGVLYQLITAKAFDVEAFKAQAKKIAQYEVDHQVAMARIKNQMYNLLTPTQQAKLKKNYQTYLAKVSRHNSQVELIH